MPPGPGGGETKSRDRSGYLVALGLVGLALAAVELLGQHGTATFAPIVGAVAVASWYRGVLPGLLALAAGWAGAWLTLDRPGSGGHLGVPSREEALRWLVPFVVSLIVLVASWALRRAERQASTRAHLAEHAHLTAESVQQLTSALSASVSPEDVAQALILRLPGMLGAMGGALGLIDGDTLRIVDPTGAPQQTIPPGTVFTLDSLAPIVVAARTGEVTIARGREEFERSYPHGAALAPGADGALAVPLVVGANVVGSMGFPFREGSSIDDDVVALARFAADLGAQALERSSLYEQERRLREAMDRISRLAPRFGSESPETVAAAICREARETFGSDIAQLWRTASTSYEVLWRDPADGALTPGTTGTLADYPGLSEALAGLEPMFIADSLRAIRGPALEQARTFGIRSSLRVPISVAGAATLVLVLQWTREITPPSQPTLVLARRFGDQAGLAVEHAERRVAERAALRGAEETRRLLDVTSALNEALEPVAVAVSALDEAFKSLNAAAGAFVRVSGDELELLAHDGYSADALSGWERFDVKADVPLAEAVRREQLIALESPAERALRYPAFAASAARGPHAAWMALPLVAGGRVVGAIGLSFEHERHFTDGDRAFALALSRQAGQALERSTLLATEHEARARAEKMAGDLAQLHALTTSLGRAEGAIEIQRVIDMQLAQGVGAVRSGVYLVGRDSTSLSLVRDAHIGGEVDDPLLPLLERRSPVADALLLAQSLWLTEDVDWSAYPELDASRPPGIGTVGVVPLVVEQRAIGALVVVLDSESPPTEEQKRLVETVARQAAQPLERVRLLDDERQARREAERANLQIRRLQTVTERLAAAPTGLAVAEVAVQEGREALGADGAVVHLNESRTGALRRIASMGVPVEIADALDDRESGDASPIWDSHASGSMIEVPDLAGLASDYPELAERIAPSGIAALRCIPLLGESGAMGVLTVTFGEEAPFDAEDRRTSVILGRQCAQALERSLLLDDERIARDRSERLQELTTSLSGALTKDEVASTFLKHAALALGASRAALGVIDHDGKISDEGSWIGDRSLIAPSWVDPPAGRKTPIRDAVNNGEPLYFDRPADLADRYGMAPSMLRGAEEDASDIAFVPLVAGRKPIAVAMLAWRGQALDLDDRAFVESFCSQCAQALDRAQRYEVERTIAETLQRSVLPETLPSMEGATVAARYLPGTAAIDVGGDWFDTIPLEDGRLGFIVGDVVGKGVQAASTMAQLRNGVRALTLDSSDPAAIVTKLNRLIDGYTDAPFATLTFIAIDPSTHEFEMVSAGHLPPLVVPPDGAPRFLEQGIQGLPLGVDSTTTYTSSVASLQAGTIVVLYTDGLVERRDRPLDEGLELLRAAATDADLDPQGLVDHLVAALLGEEDRGDDVAVLAVGLDRAPLGTFSVRLPADKTSLVELRGSFGRWLERAGIPDGDRRDLVLATWEAAANAIEHARNPAEGTVGITASLGGDTVRVEVTDSGEWREPTDRPERGLGLHLIRSMMTSLVVEPSPTGTRVLIERALSRERAGEGAIT